MTSRDEVRIHETADVHDEARIGAGTSIWHQAQVREVARVACVDGSLVAASFCHWAFPLGAAVVLAASAMEAVQHIPAR